MKYIYIFLLSLLFSVSAVAGEVTITEKHVITDTKETITETKITDPHYVIESFSNYFRVRFYSPAQLKVLIETGVDFDEVAFSDAAHTRGYLESSPMLFTRASIKKCLKALASTE